MWLTLELCLQRMCFGAFSVASSTTHVKLMVLPALIKSSPPLPLSPSIRVMGSARHKKSREIRYDYYRLILIRRQWRDDKLAVLPTNFLSFIILTESKQSICTMNYAQTFTPISKLYIDALKVCINCRGQVK